MHEDPPVNPLESQLSAYLDGELPAGETELLIRRLERDATLRRSLARYALIGEVMRTPAGVRSRPASRDFAAKITAVIAAEPSAGVVLRPTPSGSRWLKPAAGLSIAAGVAVVAVMFMAQEPESRLVATNDAPVSETVAEPADGASFIVPQITVTGPLIPAARLTNYVMAHSEYASPLGRRNVLSGMLVDHGGAGEAVPAGFVPVEGAGAPAP